ncbi:MFS transporter [Anianabacter salinae]|uniref:MFS transporter n=1 Tax=Anianabacter salinae TaxID=2851023 RepID=UPI00225DE936|nr:MFS transporter [Anianabacter salinae]MBV0911694.1 MFS transporter [Anianabacter salinae]
MLKVVASSWALLLGIGLLMVGNGLQSTLMGVRGNIEGFTTFELSLVASAYFLGFLGGSRLAPEMIRRVGHVRVFAALGSFISAVLILYPAVTDPWAWVLLRVIIGFCFSGVYVTAESWLNNATPNETRGQTLSAYMIVQMIGIVTAQGILAVGEPGGFVIFIIPSVLVSISFAPILLSISPTPPFEATKSLSLRDLFNASPLAFVGMLLMGGVFAAQFGMAAVYATEAGFTVQQVSAFVSAIFIGAMILQVPIGWLSDRMDRRLLIAIVGVIGGVAGIAGWMFGTTYLVVLGIGFVVGGMANPLYSLLIAYMNDYLEPDQMAGASGGLMFVNGIGSVAGPVVTGWLMAQIGAGGYWLFIAILMFAVAAYAAYRMTQRPAIPVDATGAYVNVLPTVSPVAFETAQEWAVEQAEDQAEEQGSETGSANAPPG